MKSIGTLELTNHVTVTDPCYTPNIWCAKQLVIVKPDRYTAYVRYTDNENRIAELRLIPESRSVDEFDLEWTNIGSAAVDSGTMTITDTEYFESFSKTEDRNEAWNKIYATYYSGRDEHGNVCHIIPDKAIVVSTGYGDGMYYIDAVIEDDEIVALRIIFISEDDDEE